MKAVLISIQPKWCELIASGKKKVEVRKTAPKLQTPFKCYIYDTKGTFDITLCPDLNAPSVKVADKGRGKVIGEFVCDWVDEFQIKGAKGVRFKRFYALAETCLTVSAMRKYAGNEPKLFGWHISDLKIYDKPKELCEFRRSCDLFDQRICGRKTICGEQKGVCDGTKTISRPPQSWCYVEEI